MGWDLPRLGGIHDKYFTLVLCYEGFLNPASPTQRDEARRIEVQYRVW